MRTAKIERLTARAFTIPTDAPEADGTIEWNSTTIVIVEAVSQGVQGIGYSYADASAARLIESKLAQEVVGKGAFDVETVWSAMLRSVRNLGRPGIASHAISAVDTALWDLKANLIGLPLASLLGRARDSIEVYGSGGFTSYSVDQLQRQLAMWVLQGIDKVKMKVGADPASDPDRVRAARKAINKAKLYVDANGAYTKDVALRMAFEFAESDVSWFEEPVSSDDLEGLRHVRDHAPVGLAIAAGEYGYDSWYFRSMLQAGAVDVLQADATRCLGVTGFMRAAALSEAFFTPLSAHTAPTLHAHLCCATRPAIHVEYFHDHARIESLLFEGALIPQAGKLVPSETKPGLGIELRKSELVAFAA